MVAAVVAVLVYLPARGRLKAFATRIVYGHRRDPEDVVRNFGSRLSRSIPLDELLLQLVENLHTSLALSAAEVWMESGGRLERTVSDPDRPVTAVALAGPEEATVARAGVSGPAWAKIWLPGILAERPDAAMRVAPVTHSGELLGLLVIERDQQAEAFTAEDERLLGDLARQVGLTLHNVRLDSALQASLDQVRRQAEALQASRGRIVAAADVAPELVGAAVTGDFRDFVGSGDFIDDSAVLILDSVALKRIASFHVDADDASEDDELLWYDVTELPVILAFL